jgi:small-conductance mechanosensitive channel
VWLALAAPLAGADVAPPSPAAPTAAPAESPAPAIISAPELVTRAEQAKAMVERIRDQTADDPVKAEIETELPGTAEKLRERTARADAMLDLSPTLDVTNDLDNEWRAREARLTDWLESLTTSAKVIESNLALLQQERELWQRTRESAETQSLPPAMLQRQDETIDLLARAEQRLQRQRASILNLQNEVAEEEIVVRGVVERIRKRRLDLGKRLFERDAPALWRPEAYAPSGDPAFVPERLRGAFARKLDLLREFRSLSVTRLEFECLVFALTLGTLLFMRRRLAGLDASEDPALAVPTKVFDRPISAALVVSIAWAIWLLPRPPGVLGELEVLLLIIPVLRLLPPELFGELRPGLIGLALLFVAGSLRGFFSVPPSVERFLILPETFGLIALLAWLPRGARTERFRSIGFFGPAVVPTARLAFVVCLAAVVANVLGLVTLSRVLLRGVLAGIYGAVAIYSLVRFAGGVATAVLRSPAGRRLRSVREHGELIRKRILSIQQWIGVGLWTLTSLRALGLQDEAAGAVAGALAAKLEVGALSISVGNVIAFFVALWLSSLTSRFVRFVLDEDVLPNISLPRGVPAAISTGAHYMILAAGFLIAIGAAGIDLSKFSLLAGALGVGIGFGLQNVVNNFVSGLILLFERPVQTGDMIDVGGLQGEVMRIGIRSSTVRTADGADVIVPNASLISDRVVNWTFFDRTRRISLDIGVAYGSDPNKVSALLVATAKAHSEVLSLPEPLAFFTGFAESALNFQLQVWCRYELGMRIKSELGIAVHDALRSAGIDIPFPQRDVHVRLETVAPHKP